MKIHILGFILCFILQFRSFCCEDCSSKNGDYDTKCPGENDPSTYDTCCWSNSTVFCCPAVDPNAFYINPTWAMIIGLSVIVSCIAIAGLLILCCFWSPCPLFDMCRIKYHYDDIIAYSDEKEEEPLNMPPEITDNSNHYSPCHVKVKKIEIV
ncbi:unnamed protein product [Bemisia tabaci]|uniref:Uncharacterized protein n=1 Tax=Bemisia tabaci TaxID=7038 RepID=A0A9P0AHC5_BEMTA|nr:unnamed protein product [Bemisia tabaci]